MFPFINPALPFTEYLQLFLNFYEVSQAISPLFAMHVLMKDMDL